MNAKTMNRNLRRRKLFAKAHNSLRRRGEPRTAVLLRMINMVSIGMVGLHPFNSTLAIKR